MNEIKTGGGFYYIVEDGSVTTMGRTDGGLKLVIPSSIDGLPVRRIGDGAFKEQKITDLSLPSGITYIGSDAFYDHHIRNLVIPDTVKTIKWSAFDHICFDLFQSVTIGENVELDNWAIGEEFVEYYKKHGSKAGTYTRKGYWYRTQSYALKSDALKGNAIWDYYIDDGSAVITGYHGKESDVTIPASIDGLDVSVVRGPGEGRSIFVYIEQEIKTLVISEGIKYIKDSAFKGKIVDGTVGICQVVIPSSVTMIGESTFQYNQLTNVTIPPGVTSIGDWAFHRNHLDSITFPDGITRIGKRTFSFNNIKTVVFPDSVTNIDEYAFYYNPLTDVTIGANVKLGHEAVCREIKNMYEKTGEQAGRYRYIIGQWRFTPAPKTRQAENADYKASDNEKQKSREKLLYTIAAAPAAAVITMLGVIASPFYSAFVLGKVFKEASRRIKSENEIKPYTPEPPPPPPPKAAGTNHIAVVKDGSVEIFGMSFPIINEGYKRPQYYLGGELKRFDIEDVIISYMGREIPICAWIELHRDGSFHGSVVYREYRHEHQGIVYSLSGGFNFYPNGTLERFHQKEYVETNFIVDGKKLALYQYDTLYLYEASGRPKTLVRGHESPENWIEIDEDGNVTHRFNEKRRP